MAIGEICSRDVVFVARNETCAQAARLMREHHVGSLVVVQEDVAPRVPSGMITDRDLAGGVIAAMVAKGPRREREERRAAL